MQVSERLKQFAALSLVALPVATLRSTAQAGSVTLEYPPALRHPLIPSHGSALLGVLYLASGPGAHPTAILFHGFPGFEQNLDLAQALRSSGWNVLAMHYRGSWGVGGSFSFVNSIEDADTEVEFLSDPATAAAYRIDPARIVVIGHSMGGLMAVSAAAHHPGIRAAVLISAWNVGAARPSEADKAKALASNDNLAPIRGTDGTRLAHEEFTHRAQLDMNRLAMQVAPRPVLMLTANDGADQFVEPFVSALNVQAISASKYFI